MTGSMQVERSGPMHVGLAKEFDPSLPGRPEGGYARAGIGPREKRAGPMGA